MISIRDHLLLGRVSNLPTVWSNVLAGWCLGGGGAPSHLAGVAAAGTALYLAGMYFNDAADAEFDRKHRPERPIPRGRISRRAVTIVGVVLSVLGVAAAAVAGSLPVLMAFGLVGCIAAYDLTHKKFSGAPLLMAACRFLLLLLAASAGRNGISGYAFAAAALLAVYVFGISAIARHEATSPNAPPWPIVFLLVPAVLVFAIQPFSAMLVAVCLILALWVILSRRLPIGACVSRLLAGMVLVDAVLVAPMLPPTLPLFAALLVLALAMQKFVPAT